MVCDIESILYDVFERCIDMIEYLYFIYILKVDVIKVLAFYHV